MPSRTPFAFIRCGLALLLAAISACTSPNDDPAGDKKEASILHPDTPEATLPALPEDIPATVADGEILAPIEPGILPDSLPELLPGEDGLADWEEENPAESVLRDEPGGWTRSGTLAIRRAREKDLPLVFWLSNTAASPLDTLLGTEVLFTPEMAKRLHHTAIGLHVDYANETVRRSAYYKSIQRRYRPKGYPTLLILLPDGTEILRRSGYIKGTAKGWFQRFDDDLERAQAAWEKRKNDLKSAGFQTWTDRQGRKFFAKAIRRDTQDATLIDPYKRVFVVPLERFSHESLVDILDGLAPPKVIKE